MTAGAPVIRTDMLGSSATFILDTGSSISLIQPGAHSIKAEATEVAPISVTGDKLAIAGQQEVGFSPQQCYFRHRFHVCQLPTELCSIPVTNSASVLSRRHRTGAARLHNFGSNRCAVTEYTN
jgi:hypothetical protein